ncbi:chromosome partitioning protein ParA [Marinobacter fuscus]|uniref:Iron-sulfur cluster carrier protein n=1 Tax=Marinobacter fuscus TaxID=2109942 RepID=A0A2T1KQ07_9GAMM|nr:P-loop NTPase [Marinobacter fuscus]PSF12217.1 chromosome partitioning protein ParA [Marinobacter fuscus]
MAVSQFNPGERDPLALRPEDCNRGHACQFCPREGECQLDKAFHEKSLLEKRLADIGQVVLVMANKGGVGKSTVTANLAIAMSQKGFRVGVADADIHGPNQSRLFNLVGRKVKLGANGLEAPGCFGGALPEPVKVASLAFLMQSDDTPIVWRDAYKHDFIHHLIGSFDWGPLDFLFVDMPPGTGNELITLADLLEGHPTAGVLTTTPQDIALMDSLKAFRFCEERQLPLIGVIENMAGVTCPNCATEFHLFPNAPLEKVLQELDLPSIAKIPFSPALAVASDSGQPVALEAPESREARAFAEAAGACLAYARAAQLEAGKQELNHLAEASVADMLANPGLLPEQFRNGPEADALNELLKAEQQRLRNQG